VRYISLLFISLIISELAAQSTDIPLNSRAYPILDRWETQSGQTFFSTVKPLSRKVFASALSKTKSESLISNEFEKNFILLETRDYHDSISPNPQPLFGRFFKYPSDAFQVNERNFVLHANPITSIGVGTEAKGQLLFENYRGVELHGTIDNKVSFYTMFTENQARYAGYIRSVTDSTLGVPYEGFWKQYRETGVDFLRAQAYIDFNITEHIGAQFGYGKHFIGDGRRSLILSDFGNNYPYLRLNTQVWKIKYTNIFAQLIGQTQGGDFGLRGTGSFTQKQLATHHLSLNLAKNFNIGFFESVIYGDSTGNLKVGYFNPIIFYRILEQQDGSADNVIMGMDFKWNLWKRFCLYGQLVIDELVVGEAFSDSGWWGNKQGFQLGAKYFDVFGISNLNAQLEWNSVRPYVYAHESNFTSYSHYNMALAHPLGANFRETLISINYQPISRLTIYGDLLLARYGKDQGGINYGQDILRSYADGRPGDYGNDMFQGEDTNLTMMQWRATYAIMHNLEVDLGYIFREESSEQSTESTNIVNATVRWNFPYRSYLF